MVVVETTGRAMGIEPITRTTANPRAFRKGSPRNNK
jgi:hypothetical protein